MAATLEFSDLSFRQDNDQIIVTLYDIFECKIPLGELEMLGEIQVSPHSIVFPDCSEKKASNKFLTQLQRSMEHMVCTVTKKPSIYVHKNSGIPLMGYIGFGIIDRGTSLIELRPMTGCNLNCNYCSVDEGLTTRKIRDFVIEEAYLFDELKKVIPLKRCDDIEIHINTQGEPTLYARFAELCKDLRTLPQIKRISTNTNGILLTRDLIDRYTQAGLTQINLSLNAIDPKKAKIIAGSGKYDVVHCMDMMRHAITRCDVTISPTYIKGYNEDELEKIVLFFKELEEIKKKENSPFKLRMGVQNFLFYKKGRNPAEEISWEDFYKVLRELEKRHGVKLVVTEGDFSIAKTPELPKTMHKDEVVSVELLCPGRYPFETLGVAKGRAVCVHRCKKTSGTMRVKILRDKDNIYDAVPLSEA